MKKTLLSAALIMSSFINAAAQSDNTTQAATNYEANQWEHYAADNYAGGTGTKDDPYLIATPEQFAKLAVEIENKAFLDDNWDDMYSKGKYWKQTANLVFNENVMGYVSSDEYGDPSVVKDAELRTFNGVGYQAGEFDYQRFAGTYDGNGFTISGLYIKPGKAATGLFNYAEGAVIKNVVIKDTYISANANVGFIAGYADKSTILNCQTSGYIYCGGSYHAGIAGTITNGSQVLNCVTDTKTWAKNNCGGLVGSSRNSSVISNCYYGGWLGGVKSNMGKFKFWGAVCPEFGQVEIETTIPDTENEGMTITTVENPSKAVNVYWTDTCTVRYVRDPKKPMNWMKAEAYNDAENCKWGKLENCKAVALADMAATVDALNAESEKIEGACRWVVGEDGLPSLEFNASTGINGIIGDETKAVYNVYNVQGVVVKKGVSEVDALKGLANGIYIVNGKKYVVM